MRSPVQTLKARPGAPGASIAARVAATTSETCTRSRICPPSSNTRGALPPSSRAEKIAATPV